MPITTAFPFVSDLEEKVERLDTER